MAKLELVRGLPGSGKSTYAKQRVLDGFCHTHYEADMFFMTKDGFYAFDHSKLYQAHKWCFESVKKDLEKGLNVVVSNTFTRKREIRPFFNLCIELDCELDILTLKTSFGSIHDVHEETMNKMRQRFVDHEDVIKEFLCQKNQ